MTKANHWIVSTAFVKGRDDRKSLNIWKDKQRKSTRMITVPIDAPELDPYDKETGRGFMTPNAIIRSGLSANAKLMFSVLRSFICYDLGVVFPTEEQIEQRMSKERKANRKALKELEQYGVIRIVKMLWQGHLKNYCCFESEDKWKLPRPKQYSYSKSYDQDEEIDDSQIDIQIKNNDIVALNNTAKEKFVAGGEGLHPEQTFGEEEEMIDFFALHDE